MPRNGKNGGNNLKYIYTGLDKESEKRKVAILLHSVCGRCVKIFNTFNLDMDKATITEVKSKFDTYFEPTKNLTMIRHKFYKL